MRDTRRILNIIKELEYIWSQNPDLRLGQLILNAFSLHNGVDSRVYMMEDREFISELKEFYRREPIGSDWGV